MRYPSDCTMGDKELEKLMNGSHEGKGPLASPKSPPIKRENGRVPARPERLERLEPGARCRVLRSDDPSLPARAAEVLQVRVDRARLCLEYYVHYADSDRRLDEWVSQHRIAGHHDDGPRQLRRKHDEDGLHYDVPDPAVLALRREHETLTRIKYINKIQLGAHEIDTWYFSPYPEEYGKRSHLYICEFCLRYMKFERSYAFHLYTCRCRKPEGKQIYKKDSMAMFEACGRDNKFYCQNLCLLAKLFLDHKTIYYDIEQFLFYVLCEVDSGGAHPVGYFSKERDSLEGFNVACILTLPPYQRKGYGKLLIALSYELSKLEHKPGSPEKPLSDLGLRSYRSYWCYVLLSVLGSTEQSRVTVQELCLLTGISRTDVLYTLKYLHLLRFWKSENVVLVNPKAVKKLLCSKHYKVPSLLVDSGAMQWSPRPSPPNHPNHVKLRRTTS